MSVALFYFTGGFMAQYDGSIRINTQIDTKNASSQMMGLVNQIQKASDRVNSLRAKMDALKDAQIPTQQYKDIETDIARAEKELQKLIEKQAQMQADGKDSGTAWERLNQRIQASKDYISYAREEMQALVDSGKAFTVGRDTQEYANLGQQLGYAESDLVRLNRRYDELNAKQVRVPEQFEKMRKSAKKAFGAISQGTKKSSGLFSTFISRLKGIALSLLIFNWISKGFNAMISGMKKGFENFAGYSDFYAQNVQNMKNAMSTLGNQFAAAFAPIVQIVIPWLTSLINTLTNAISHIAQFIAILSGKSTFTKAKKVQDDYNKSLGGTAKAADKARGALAKFDDLDVLEKKQEDASGGGSGVTDATDMFEEVPVNKKALEFLDKIKLELKSIIGYAKKLKDIFMQGFFDGLGDWEYRWDSIKKSISSIKNSLIDIWTDPSVLSAADGWAQSVAYMLGSIVGSLASIGLTIATNLVGGIAKYLEQNKERIKKNLIEMFNVWEDINNLLSEFFQSFAYVFESFASENGQQLTANIIGMFVDGFMGALELASKLARDILNIFIQPFVENKEELRTALEGFLGVLAEVTGTIKQGIDDTFDKLNEVYDEHFKPFFDSVAQGISDLTGKLLDFWIGTIQPILDEWAVKFDDLWIGHIQPAINATIDVFGQLADTINEFWNNVLLPFVNWLIDDVEPDIAFILSAAGEAFNFLILVVYEVIEGIMNTISSLLEFLENVFKGDWEAVWNDIVGFLIRAVVPDMHGAGEQIIEGIKQGFLGKWESLKETVGEVAASISEKFKEVLGIHSPSTVMEENGSYMVEGLHNGIESTIDSVYALFNPDTWTEIGTQMFNALMETVTLFREMWTETFALWQEENTELYFGYDIWYEQWQNMLAAYNDVNSEFISEWQSNITNWWNTMVMPYFTVLQWKTFGDNMRNGIMQGFKAIVNNIAGVLNQVIQLFNSAYKQLQDSMNSLIDDYNAKAAIMGTSTLSHVSYKAMQSVKVPALASGAVIRGGNPFLAILGDQPTGQTNIETPLPTMVDAFKQAITEMGGIGSERVPVNININYDNETFMRIAIPDLLAELGRQGYDVDVLGVT